MVLVKLLAAGQRAPRNQFMHIGVARAVADVLRLQPAPGGRGNYFARLRLHVAEANLVVLARNRQMRVLDPGDFG